MCLRLHLDVCFVTVIAYRIALGLLLTMSKLVGPKVVEPEGIAPSSNVPLIRRLQSFKLYLCLLEDKTLVGE